MEDLNQFKYDTIWKYLNELGVLENGTEIEIAEAKSKYWRSYRTWKKKLSRKQRPELNISFEDKAEKKKFRDIAKKHQKPLSVFIREAALAYVNQCFVQANEEQWTRVVQELKMMRMGIKQIAEEENVGYHRSYNLLLEKLMDLETNLTEVLNNPPLLETSLEKTLIKEPWRREKLLHIIQSI